MHSVVGLSCQVSRRTLAYCKGQGICYGCIVCGIGLALCLAALDHHLVILLLSYTFASTVHSIQYLIHKPDKLTSMVTVAGYLKGQGSGIRREDAR